MFNDVAKGGTGKRAEAIAIQALNTLHHFRPDGIAGIRGEFMGKTARPIGSNKLTKGYLVELDIPVNL
jgi:hypothetical protein